ncbi:sigma factor, partial [Singulisphaera rosea]
MTRNVIGRTMTELTPSDEELMARLAEGSREALGPLHGRYASLLFDIASRSLGRASAEEIVQDVFVTVWRKAEQFDP